MKSSWLRTISSILDMVIIPSLVLLPIALLYFVPMSKAGSYMVVACFSMFFTTVLSLSEGISPYYKLVATVGYIAVLATLLVQLQNVGPSAFS